MEKIDFKKELKHFYKPSVKSVERVTVPGMNFLMIDGQGDPNTSRESSFLLRCSYVPNFFRNVSVYDRFLIIEE